MNVYLVGGAVRDKLLGDVIKERDWVVVGETQSSMLAAGYQQVGKDFPVFLHPKTKEEYALARKERKISKGYHGFEFDAGATVTLEEDLLRRDLTINAIAQDHAGNIVDPYYGVEDLNNKILRHVSPAFSEDPVRILRIARFASRFSDFSIAIETQDLMKEMVKEGEVNALVAERVWKEFEKAMSEIAPWRFIEVLSDCGALKILFPIFENKKLSLLDNLKKINELTKINVERILLMLLATDSPIAVEDLCQHYRAPKPLMEMALLLMKYQSYYQDAAQLSAREVLDFFHALDAFRREERFKQWLKLCALNFQSEESLKYLLAAFDGISKIELPNSLLEENKGKEIGVFIDKQRLEKLEYLLKKFN